MKNRCYKAEIFYFYNLCNNLCSWVLKNEVIYRCNLCMHSVCIMQHFKINAQFNIYSQAGLNIGQYVELTFLEVMLIFSTDFLTYCILKVKVKVDSTQMRIVLVPI